MTSARIFKIRLYEVVGDEASVIANRVWILSDGLEDLLTRARELGAHFPDKKDLAVDVMDGESSRCRVFIHDGSIGDVICDPELF